MRYESLYVGPWRARFMGREFCVSTGRGGIGEKMREGDGVTPRGVFRVENWLARPDRLCSDFQPIHPRDGWSDDANSDDYNHRVSLPYSGSHERLFRADGLYDLIGILDYNRSPVEAGKGSAIFIHAWRRPRFPTEGCVAFAPDDLHFIAMNWGRDSRVVIQ